MGRQENKQDKEARIRSAAAALFLERGYDLTTVAAVAERAGVAKGTVFLYAETKLDLLALVFEDRIRGAIAEGLAGLDAERPLHLAFLDVFRRFFSIYEPHPELARHFVRELLFAGGRAAQVRNEVDQAFVSGLMAHVAERQARGELRSDASALLAATNAFALYIVALMAWLSGAIPSRAAAEQYLGGSLELAMSGLYVTSAPRTKRSAARGVTEKGRKR